MTNVKKKNHSLLAKGIWRIEKEALWSCLIDAKYGSPFHPQQSTIKLSKRPWSYIIKQAGIIQENTVKVIGNGESTFFWMDNWVGTSPLKLLFLGSLLSSIKRRHP